MENNQIFREKSLERIQSPENLNQYIKVANPGMWLSLGAVLCILIGFIVWGAVAKLDTTLESAVVVSDSKGVCYFSEDMQQFYKPGMTVNIEGENYVLADKSSQAVKLSSSDESEAFLLHLMNKDDKENEWFDLYRIDNINLADGVYKGKSVIDSVTPLSFFFDDNSSN